MPGAAALPRPAATGMALPYCRLQAQLLAGGDKLITESPTVARMRRGGALLTVATGINAVNIIRNRPAPRVASAEATGERGQSL